MFCSFVALFALIAFSHAAFQTCSDVWVANINGSEYNVGVFQVNFDNAPEYYDETDGKSYNADLNQNNANSISVRFVKSNDNIISLIAFYDSIDSGSGGNAVTVISHSGDLSNSSSTLVDGDTEDNFVQETGSFTFTNIWISEFNDGFVLPVPEFSCFDVTFKQTSNVESVRYVSPDNIVAIPKSDGEDVAFRFCTIQVCEPLVCPDTPCCDEIDNPNQQTGQGYYEFQQRCQDNGGGLNCVETTNCALCQDKFASKAGIPTCERFKCDDTSCCASFQQANSQTGQGYQEFNRDCLENGGGLHCIRDTGCRLCRSEDATDTTRPICEAFLNEK